MFKFLGLLVAIYTAYSVLRGEVYAKSGAWGKSVSRDENPQEFWLTVVIYSALAIALIAFF